MSVESLATLPNLRSLYVNLQTEDQVDLIMRLLPNLEYLNGLPVDRDAIDEEGDITGQMNAVQQEAIENGHGQVTELPEEEDSQGYDETQQEMQQQTRGPNDTSLMSAQSAARNADVLAQNLDTEELESLAMCFDNIRLMRQSNQAMVEDNDDTALGDQFDEVLSNMIANLTEQLKEEDSAVNRGKIVISGKRDLMQLLVEKTLEYHKVVDPQAEVVLQELATQYENLIDQGLNLIPQTGGDGAGRSDSDKDREIRQLRKELAQAKSNVGSGAENKILR